MTSARLNTHLGTYGPRAWKRMEENCRRARAPFVTLPANRTIPREALSRRRARPGSPSWSKLPRPLLARCLHDKAYAPPLSEEARAVQTVRTIT